MSTMPVCPCDAANPAPITNLPGLSQIAFRAGNFNDFRRALLTPLLAGGGQPPVEQSLTAWQSGVNSDPSVPDLAVMMVEWWAYLADILTFYNERIANEDYLRTAALPETPAKLVQLLGYRPRPAIGATGNLAALVSPSVLPGQVVTLPKGLQFQSKPGPGAAPQTFELSAATPIGLPDQVAAITPPNLIATTYRFFQVFGSSGVNQTSEKMFLPGKSTFGGPNAPERLAQYGVLLQGSVTSLSNGAPLLLGTRDDAVAPTLIALTSAPSVQTVAGGAKQTVLTFSAYPAPPTMSASNARLLKASQNAALWTANLGNIAGTTTLQMAGVVRQIRPNDWLVLSAPTFEPQLVQVASVTDVLGDASSGGSPNSIPTSDKNPIPVLHTQLTLNSNTNLNSEYSDGANASAITVLFGWVEVGTLIDQPPSLWDGVSTALQAVQPGQFATGGASTILLQDSNGVGEEGTASVGSDGSLAVAWESTTLVPFSPGLQPPIEVFYNLLPVTCGKTVANEVLGSGDASVAGQSFMLSKSPVTYLASGSVYASTIALTVNGIPWTEVASFYNQPANAQVFVTREDSNQNTWVDFGDGVNGARLTTGTNNVVATYRIGAGAASPPAGKLTVIAQSYPGLQSVVNPVAVSGGSDPDPASLLKEYAPRSVLTFGRAVSIFDYQALAAQAPGVTMASATWSWDSVNQRASVTIYVAGEQNVAVPVQALLSAAGDPSRPVNVVPATQLSVSLTMKLVVTAGMDPGAIKAAVQTALCDPSTGLFSPSQIGIGQGVFDSMIEATVLSVRGVVAIQSSQLAINGCGNPGPFHNPGEGSYFSLDSSDFHPSTLVAGND